MSDQKTNDAAGVAEPHKKKQTRAAQKPRRQPRYHVILLDDDQHTYEYVVTMLRALFGHPFERGYQLAKQVDSSGRAIVLTTTMEHAELKRNQIGSHGPDHMIASCKGSMTAIIEPADEDDGD